MLATSGVLRAVYSVLFLIVWVAIAFWPARVAGREGHSVFGFLHSEPDLLPVDLDSGLRRQRPRTRTGAVTCARQQLSSIGRQPLAA